MVVGECVGGDCVVVEGGDGEASVWWSFFFVRGITYLNFTTNIKQSSLGTNPTNFGTLNHVSYILKSSAAN